MKPAHLSIALITLLGTLTGNRLAAGADAADADDFARKVLTAGQVVREKYVREVRTADLVDAAIRGLYQQLKLEVPEAIAARLAKVGDLDQAGLQALLRDARTELGDRETLRGHRSVDLALRAMLTHLDSNSTYMDAETSQRHRQVTAARYAGVGLQIRKDQETGLFLVVTPIRGGPAHRAGIFAGDHITRITRSVDSDGNPLRSPEVIEAKKTALEEAVRKLSGKEKTAVTVTVEREGEDAPLQFELTRATFKTETVLGLQRRGDDSWSYFADPAQRIAYLRITQFGTMTAQDLQSILQSLTTQGMKGCILDLRFNSGGLLTPTLQSTDLFIDDGLITTIRGRDGKEIVYRGKSEGSYLNFPMVCLTNRVSSSGAEILAACLQDHQRAAIAGERTLGLAGVHQFIPFDGGDLKLMTASFRRPSGRNLDKSLTSGKDQDDWGVRPDPGLELRLPDKELADLGTSLRRAEVIQRKDRAGKDPLPSFKDRQLERAVQYLREQGRRPGQAND